MSLFLAPIHPAFAGNRTVTSIPEWLNTDHPREVIEAALAHVVQSRVEAPYARSDRFDRMHPDGRPGALLGPSVRGGSVAVEVRRRRGS